MSELQRHPISRVSQHQEGRGGSEGLSFNAKPCFSYSSFVCAIKFTYFLFSNPEIKPKSGFAPIFSKNHVRDANSGRCRACRAERRANVGQTSGTLGTGLELENSMKKPKVGLEAQKLFQATKQEGKATKQIRFENKNLKTQKRKTSGGQFWPIWRKGGAAKIEKIEDREPECTSAHVKRVCVFALCVRHCMCIYIVYIYICVSVFLLGCGVLSSGGLCVSQFCIEVCVCVCVSVFDWFHDF